MNEGDQYGQTNRRSKCAAEIARVQEDTVQTNYRSRALPCTISLSVYCLMQQDSSCLDLVLAIYTKEFMDYLNFDGKEFTILLRMVSKTKILVIMGSLRKANTYRTVQKIEQLHKKIADCEYEYVFLKDINLGLCKGCFSCISKGEEHCPLKDDREWIVQKIESSY